MQDNCTRKLAILHSANLRLHRCKLLVAGASGEDIAAMFRKPREDSRDLCRSLPFSKNDLWHSRAQRPVMIDFGKPEIFERQMSQAIDGLIRSNVTFADLQEKLADGFGVQEALSGQSAFSRDEFLD